MCSRGRSRVFVILLGFPCGTTLHGVSIQDGRLLSKNNVRLFEVSFMLQLFLYSR